MGKHGGGGHGGHSFGHGGHSIGHTGHSFGGMGMHHHSFGSHHGSGGTSAVSYDTYLNVVTPPVAISGSYSFVGSQMSFDSHLPNFMAMQEGHNAQTNMAITSASILLCGNKVKQMNSCCIVATIFLGACFIFPLCFMCCTWWKKIVAPFYALDVIAYQQIGEFLEMASSVTNFTLTVIDNAFSAEKAQILTSAIGNSRLNGFTFTNLGIGINYLANQFSDFEANMRELKKMKPNSVISWGNTIIM